MRQWMRQKLPLNTLRLVCCSIVALAGLSLAVWLVRPALWAPVVEQRTTKEPVPATLSTGVKKPATVATDEESVAAGRAIWEKGVDTGHPIMDVGIDAFMVWTSCRHGVMVQVDSALNAAQSAPPSPAREATIATFDGIQDHWWFQTCLLVSPLIAIPPPNAPGTNN